MIIMIKSCDCCCHGNDGNSNNTLDLHNADNYKNNSRNNNDSNCNDKVKSNNQ